MLQNEAVLDRAVRVLLGLALLMFMFAGRIGAWGWIGVLLLATGIAGYCPFYHLMHWSTRRNRVAHG